MARVVVMEGPVNRKSTRDVIDKLRKLNSESHAPIVLLVHSPGGAVTAGLAVTEIMETIESPVYTLGAGMVISAGSLIFAAGEPGHRYMMPNAQMMIHQPRGGGLLKQPTLELLNHVKDETGARMARYSNITEKELAARMERDTYLSAEEAVEIGLADSIIEHRGVLEDYL